MSDFKSVLMERDGLSEEDFTAVVDSIREEVAEGGNVEEILFDSYGLEPDYVIDVVGLL